MSVCTTTDLTGEDTRFNLFTQTLIWHLADTSCPLETGFSRAGFKSTRELKALYGLLMFETGGDSRLICVHLQATRPTLDLAT